MDRPYIIGPSVTTGGHTLRSIRRDSRRPNGLAPLTDLLPLSGLTATWQ
jgi:hypothetical protein